MTLSKILLYLGFFFLITSIVFAVIYHASIERPNGTVPEFHFRRQQQIQSETMSLSIVSFILSFIFK